MAKCLHKGAVLAEDSPRVVIGKINALSVAAFCNRFFPSPKLLQHHDYDISYKPATQLDKDEFMECFRLIETTSAADYEQSSTGWSPKAKQLEMKEDNMHYLLVRQVSHMDSTSEILAFLSFMFTVEDGCAVLYIYEIHLAEAHRGNGLGSHLVLVVAQCATKGAVQKVMLTCFRCNTAAMAFYSKLGFSEDESSPPAKRLRGGRKIIPPYRILSKRVGWSANELLR